MENVINNIKSQHSSEGQDDIATISNNRVEVPRKYKVLMHNDDYTTMEFVVLVLQKIFHRSKLEAQEIMWQVHKQGVGVAGAYTKEVAEMKLLQAHRFAKQSKFPLKCTMERE